MKWSKYLSGKKKGASAEIAEENVKLKADRANNKVELARAKEAKAQAGVEVLGGERDKSEIEPLAAAVRDLEDQLETLDLVIQKMDEKFLEAQEREKQAQVAEIDKKIQNLKRWRQDARQDYIKVRVMCDAYKKLLTDPLMGVGMARMDSLLITGTERAAHADEAEKITGGHGSIMAEIMSLRTQREKLIKGETHTIKPALDDSQSVLER